MSSVNKRRQFAELVPALRPHFFVLPALAALAGAATLSEHLTPRAVLAAAIAGLGWGAGQLVNDVADRASDGVNAPQRAIASGRLSVPVALAAALGIAVSLLAATFWVHPRAWALAVLGGVLIVAYGPAKRRPLLGNLAHAALMAVVFAIGRASAMSLGDGEVTWERFARSALFGEGTATSDRVAVLATACIAAWYLQSNYEKDRPGDRAAGDRTLAVVTSVRTSALVRVLGLAAIALLVYPITWAWAPLDGLVSHGALFAGLSLGLASIFPPLLRGTDASALAGYRWTVPATILCLLALAARILGPWGAGLVLLTALAMFEAAFRRTANP